jgi:transcriptional regulator with XRE-family HTH domain
MRPNMAERLAFNLKTLMERGDINQLELAKATGVKQPTIHHLLKEHTNRPRLQTIIKLANYFHIDVDELLYHEVDDTSNLRMNWKGTRIPLMHSTKAGL